MTNKMTFVRPAALAKLDKIMALLAEKPMTAHQLATALPMSKRWAQAYIDYLWEREKVYIKRWAREPLENSSREYPRPMYAVVPEGKRVYDAKKPEPYTKTEINKREWRAIKADPERHLDVLLQRRKNTALARVSKTAASNNPFTMAA